MSEEIYYCPQCKEPLGAPYYTDKEDSNPWWLDLLGRCHKCKIAVWIGGASY